MIKRIPFILNLNDPDDAAIWDVLGPLLERRRASQFIRGVIAQALGFGGLIPSIPLTPRSPESVKAKRKEPALTVEQSPVMSEPSTDDIDMAAGKFLSMFG